MDARLDPAKFAGLSEGDAHVIRNAGGRASDDAIRSLVISHKLLGTNEWFVVHHTDCGMCYFNTPLMGDLLATSLATAKIENGGFVNVTTEGGNPAGKFINWLTISDEDLAVKEDIERIATNPLTAPGIPVHGYIYDVKTGKLRHVASTTTA
jgi:carbonic anhydrase